MYKFEVDSWRNIEDLHSKYFICWNCNNNVASDRGYRTGNNNSSKKIFLCPHCHAPNIYDVEGKCPISALPGKEINKLPENIGVVYSEIRKCMQSGCFNGAIMLMRKLIMHIAVEEGAEDGKKFIEYVNYLCDNGIVPKKSKNKADSVRDLGNATNHEIENRTKEEAENCFEFIELLLKVNYEFADEEEEGDE